MMERYNDRIYGETKTFIEIDSQELILFGEDVLSREYFFVENSVVGDVDKDG